MRMTVGPVSTSRRRALARRRGAPARRAAAAAFAAALLAALPAAAQKADRSVAVEAMTVGPTVLVEAVSAVGDLESEASVLLRSEIAGRVKEIGFVEGAPVRQGQALIRLNDAIARAELDQATARRELSRSNYDRARALNNRGHSSAQTLDIAREEVRVNEASVELAEARLAKTVIDAPFDGVVGLTAVSVGDYIEAGDDIVNLEKISPLKVDFRVPERYLRVIQVGRKVEVALDALPGEVHEGEVYAIDPRIRAADRSVAVRARLPNPEGRLRPGLFARVRLIVDRRTQAIVIPEEALVPRGDRRYVYKIVGDKAELVEIRIGLRETGRVEIVSGLATGDVIVTAGQAKVRPGSTIRIVGGPAAIPTPAAPEAADGAGGSGS